MSNLNEMEVSPFAMKAGEVVSKSGEVSESSGRRARSIPAFDMAEFKSALDDLREARTYLNFNPNIYTLRPPTLRDWQERFDRAIARLERLAT